MSYDIVKAKKILGGNKTQVADMVPITEVVASLAPATMESIFERVDKEINNYVHRFFIEVIPRLELSLQNAINDGNGDMDQPLQTARAQIVVHAQCPSPKPDHSIWMYTKSSAQLDLLWSLPMEEVCEIYRENAVHVVKEEWHLLSFILQYYSGKLMQLAKKLNGERHDSVALESGTQLEGAQTVVLSAHDSSKE